MLRCTGRARRLTPASPRLQPCEPQERPFARRVGISDRYSLSARKERKAKKASEISHTYLLMTVLFSAVLFLGGITVAFERKRIRVVVLALAVLVLTAAAITLAFLPLANERGKGREMNDE